MYALRTFPGKLSRNKMDIQVLTGVIDFYATYEKTPVLRSTKRLKKKH